MGWFIIFSSLIWISFGLSLSLRFCETSWARSFVDWVISSVCSFGMTREWPLLRGLMSRMAMLFLFSAIL